MQVECDDGGLVCACVWGESTCCGTVKKGLALEGEKGNPGGESGEQRHGGENSVFPGGQIWITKHISVTGEKDVRDRTVRVEAGKGFGDQMSGNLK